jgi:hypothetical protein
MAAFGLAGVGVTINGWFARSLGATETAEPLFTYQACGFKENDPEGVA